VSDLTETESLREKSRERERERERLEILKIFEIVEICKLLLYKNRL
jgi:hypothetical protein